MLKRNDGFTLVEMLVAMVIALVISLASFSLIEVVMRRSGEISSRVETTQRARGVMDDVTRALRSQVCVLRSDGSPAMTSPRSVYAGTASSVSFFADTADESLTETNTTMPVPMLRTLTLTGTTLTETTRPGVNDKSKPGVDAVSFAAGPDRNRRLLSDVDLLPDKFDVDIPMFRYYAFDLTKKPPTPTLAVDPGSGLTPAQAASIARISISFRVLPAGQIAKPGAPIPRGSAGLQGDIFVRTADPNLPIPKPTCL
jgi:prepilin-type N-terminal cleavage/methylation domain-containing protein